MVTFGLLLFAGMFAIAGIFISIEAKRRSDNSRKAVQEAISKPEQRAASDRIRNRAA